MANSRISSERAGVRRGRKNQFEKPTRKTHAPKLSDPTKCKLSLLQLVEELGSVAEASQLMGRQRDSFSEIRRTFPGRRYRV